MSVPEPINPAEAVKAAMPDVVKDVVEFRDEITIVVDAEKIPEVLRFVRDTKGLIYNYLSDISAVDYYEPDAEHDRPARFGVSYHVYSMLYNRRLRVKTYVEDGVNVPTAIPVWPAANWLEREIHDLMGIRFDGHPDMRRILMPADWDGHPHRRDYPLGEETVQFSFNVEEIMKYKPFAKE